MLGNLEFNPYTHGPDQLIPVFAVIDIYRNGRRVEKRIEQVIYCMLHSTMSQLRSALALLRNRISQLRNRAVFK